MAHLGTLRDFKFKGDVDDIRGATLYGRGNEKLGKVDDVIFDHAGGMIQYLVVDTGGWLSSNKFLVPADRVNAYQGNDADFTCDLTKEQIERFPEYKDSLIRDEKDWNNYEARYRGTFNDDGGILHREGSDHLITPEAGDMPAFSGSSDAGIDATPTRIADRFATPAPEAGKTRMRPAGTAARAEDNNTPGRSISNQSAAWTEEGAEARNRRATDRLRPDDNLIESDTVHDQIGNRGSAYEVSDIDAVPLAETSQLDPPSYRAEELRNKIAEIADREDRDDRGELAESFQQSERLNVPASDRLSRNRRLRDFEENLRRNRVDITSSCRACGVDHDQSRHDHSDKDEAA
jgi:hypothetical protein